MLPKIASALARVLDPIKPIERPGETLSMMKSAESGDGGHGTLGYEKQEKSSGDPTPEGAEKLVPEHLAEDGVAPARSEKSLPGAPFVPGLTQVILDLNANRVERNAAGAAQTYETGAKDQKKNARLPKGSMLDKKVG